MVEKASVGQVAKYRSMRSTSEAQFRSVADFTVAGNVGARPSMESMEIKSIASSG